MKIATRAFAAVLAMLFAVPGDGAGRAGPVGHFRVAIDTNAANADYSQTAARNSVVILQQYQAPRMQQLKAANPGLKVLMYKNLSGDDRAQPSGFVSGGVATQDAASHPSGTCSTPAASASRPLLQLDLDRRRRQRAPTSSSGPTTCSPRSPPTGWDGVFMDDTNPTMSWHYDVDRIAKYPSDAAWQAATRSALVVDRRALPRRGQARDPELLPTRRPTRRSSRTGCGSSTAA